MEKEFIPYEQALALKELGFDNTCHAYYSQYRNKDIHLKDLGLCNRLGISEENVLAPLYQQAFRWFREKYNLHQDISTFVWDYDKEQLGFSLRTYLNPLNTTTEKKVHPEVYETYEEAELACLIKLIEIVRNG